MHLRLKVRELVRGDIRRVRRDKVQPIRKRPRLRPQKHVALCRRAATLRVSPDIFPKIPHGGIFQLHAYYPRPRHYRAYSKPHSPAPCAQVQPPGARPYPSGNSLHQRGRVLPGNEHALAHPQRKRHKRPLAQDILQGPAGGPLRDSLQKFPLLSLIWRFIAVQGQPRPVQPQKALRKPGRVKTRAVHSRLCKPCLGL